MPGIPGGIGRGGPRRRRRFGRFPVPARVSKYKDQHWLYGSKTLDEFIGGTRFVALVLNEPADPMTGDDTPLHAQRHLEVPDACLIRRILLDFTFALLLEDTVTATPAPLHAGIQIARKGSQNEGNLIPGTNARVNIKSPAVPNDLIDTHDWVWRKSWFPLVSGTVGAVSQFPGPDLLGIQRNMLDIRCHRKLNHGDALVFVWETDPGVTSADITLLARINMRTT